MTPPYYELLHLHENGETIADLGRFAALPDALAGARDLLRDDPSMWLSICYVDPYGLCDTVVAEVLS